MEKVKYIVHTRVQTVREHFRKVHLRGTGTEAVFEETSLGWFAYFEGSHEALHLGMERPELAPGDRVKITFEREP